MTADGYVAVWMIGAFHTLIEQLGTLVGEANRLVGTFVSDSVQQFGRYSGEKPYDILRTRYNFENI